MQLTRSKQIAILIALGWIVGTCVTAGVLILVSLSL